MSETIGNVGKEDEIKLSAALGPESEDARLQKVLRAQNPLIEAARVLLRAQADMPDRLDAVSAEHLNLLLVAEVETFSRLCTRANIRSDHVIGASYCLCTALDEQAMQALPHDGEQNGVSVWAQSLLAIRFHRDGNGGQKVYALIGRLFEEQEDHIDLLEVIYRILSYGFEGQYRHRPDGQRQHMAVRTRIFNALPPDRRQAPMMVLAPNGLTNVKPKRQLFFDIPVWYAVVLYSGILLAMFGYYKYELSTKTASVQKQFADIAHMTPPPAPPALHLKGLLKAEIAAGTVSVDEDGRASMVRFRGDSMFQPGGGGVNAAMHPLIAKIAAEVAKVPGKVTVAGYTDNIPIKSRQFASNQALSEERATQVMQMLQTAGVQASRLEAVGKGDADPIGNNQTAQGRARNRRVEITVALTAPASPHR